MAFWFEANASTGNLVTFRTLSSTTDSYSAPSIAVNSAHDVLLGFSAVSTEQHVSAAFAMYRNAQQSTAQPFVQKYALGEAPLIDSASSTNSRIGDYSQTLTDPLDSAAFWTIQERSVAAPTAVAQGWSTVWAKVKP
jgi:hypothetical protein